MALNIANHKVEEKAILASRILGTNKTAAVEYALAYFLKHHRPVSERGTDIREISRLLDELADLPILDNRKADEIIGYKDSHKYNDIQSDCKKPPHLMPGVDLDTE